MVDVLRAVDKVKRQYDLLHTASLSSVDEDDALFLKTEYKVVRILCSDIILVEGMSEYLRIHLSSSSARCSQNTGSAVSSKTKNIMVLLSMKKMEERLPERNFMRIHKSYIINMRHIVEISKNRVLLSNGMEVPIGESYRERLSEYIAKKFLGR